MDIKKNLRRLKQKKKQFNWTFIPSIILLYY